MPSTPKLALRYPAGTDAPDGPGAFLALASDVENVVKPDWVSYSPTTGAFGFTSLIAQYRQTGGRVAVNFRGTFNVANAGGLAVGLPKPAASPGGVSAIPFGRAIVSHGGNKYEFGFDITADGQFAQFTYPGTPPQFFYVTNTGPFAWAGGDIFTACFVYETA